MGDTHVAHFKIFLIITGKWQKLLNSILSKFFFLQSLYPSCCIIFAKHSITNLSKQIVNMTVYMAQW